MAFGSGSTTWPSISMAPSFFAISSAFRRIHTHVGTRRPCSLMRSRDLTRTDCEVYATNRANAKPAGPTPELTQVGAKRALQWNSIGSYRAVYDFGRVA